MKTNEKQKRVYLEAYDEHSDGLFRHALWKTSNREFALDIVQDTFTNVWEYMVNGGKIKNIKAFLYRTLANKIIDHYRKKQSESLDNLIEKGLDVGFNDNEKIESRLMSENIWEKVALLDESHKEIIILRYMNDLSVSEISLTIGISENSVSVRIHRALEKLKQQTEII